MPAVFECSNEAIFIVGGCLSPPFHSCGAKQDIGTGTTPNITIIAGNGNGGTGGTATVGDTTAAATGGSADNTNDNSSRSDATGGNSAATSASTSNATNTNNIRNRLSGSGSTGTGTTTPPISITVTGNNNGGDATNGDPKGYYGTHGYLAEDPELDGIFIASGYGIKLGTKLGQIHNRDVAPTIAELLGLPLPNVEGHALKEILAP